MSGPDRVWHIGNGGIYSAKRVHASGHVRPKSVSFGTELAAARAWLRQIEAGINEATRQMKRARTDSYREGVSETRDKMRADEARAKALVRQLERVKP